MFFAPLEIVVCLVTLVVLNDLAGLLIERSVHRPLFSDMPRVLTASDKNQSENNYASSHALSYFGIRAAAATTPIRPAFSVLLMAVATPRIRP